MNSKTTNRQADRPTDPGPLRLVHLGLHEAASAAKATSEAGERLAGMIATSPPHLWDDATRNLRKTSDARALVDLARRTWTTTEAAEAALSGCKVADLPEPGKVWRQAARAHLAALREHWQSVNTGPRAERDAVGAALDAALHLPSDWRAHVDALRHASLEVEAAMVDAKAFADGVKHFRALIETRKREIEAVVRRVLPDFDHDNPRHWAHLLGRLSIQYGGEPDAFMDLPLDDMLGYVDALADARGGAHQDADQSQSDERYAGWWTFTEAVDCIHGKLDKSASLYKSSSRGSCEQALYRAAKKDPSMKATYKGKPRYDPEKVRKLANGKA